MWCTGQDKKNFKKPQSFEREKEIIRKEKIQTRVRKKAHSVCMDKFYIHVLVL